MKTKPLYISLLVILSIGFIGLQLFAFEMYASIVRLVLIGLLILLYHHRTKMKRGHFFMFLVTFFIADVLGLSYWMVFAMSSPTLDFVYNNFVYYIVNGLYMLSYIFLIIKVLKGMNIREVITKLPAHFVILVVLDIFCVTIVTDTAKTELSSYQYTLEFLYNAVIMTLLTFAVINYIYKVDKKAMNLLMGSIFIVLSEMIQLAYYYVNEDNNLLNVLCSLFLVIAFFFLYLQETLKESVDLNTFEKHIEA